MATLVFYDGLCGLCDRFVRFLVSRDRRGRLRFAPLQGELARRTLAPKGHDPADLDTVFVVADWTGPGERVLRRSRAVLHATAQLGPGWRFASRLASVVPSGLADAGYDLVARNRYRMFGRFDACRVPPAAWRERFVQQSEDQR
jgi:predicted DCC family thiol-disulfide oxidoreductase YuxK